MKPATKVAKTSLTKCIVFIHNQLNSRTAQNGFRGFSIENNLPKVVLH